MSEATKEHREPYEKPVLRKIDLVAEEVLAAGCKTLTASAPSGVNCTAVPCSDLGS